MCAHYGYDEQDRITSLWYGSESDSGIRYSYNSAGALGLTKDLMNNLRTRYTYDLSGRLVGVRRSKNANADNGSLVVGVTYEYEDKTNRLASSSVQLPGTTMTTGYVYGDASAGEMADAVYGVTRNGTEEISYTYDGLGRRTARTVNGQTTQYVYRQINYPEKTTTLQVEQLTDRTGTTYHSYDELGNLSGEYRADDTSVSYEYDALNQLTRATIGSVTYTYTYDQGGNLLSKSDGTTTDTYEYTDSSWADLLTSYNGQTITYDAIGNPLTYRDEMTMTWQRGRQLASVDTNIHVVEYTYDEDGTRLTRSVNGNLMMQFHTVNGVLYGQTDDTGKTMLFLKDETGTNYGFTYNGATYYYLFTLQGDVKGIVDSNGTQVVTYTYDPYGKPLTTTGTLANTIGLLNPIRSRGYYYDDDTGFYYLGSRYYDPEIGRFISPDTTDILTATPT